MWSVFTFTHQPSHKPLHVYTQHSTTPVKECLSRQFITVSPGAYLEPMHEVKFFEYATCFGLADKPHPYSLGQGTEHSPLQGAFDRGAIVASTSYSSSRSIAECAQFIAFLTRGFANGSAMATAVNASLCNTMSLKTGTIHLGDPVEIFLLSCRE